MCDNSKSNNISRRNFLGKVGTGVVGSLAAAPVLKAMPKNFQKEIEQEIERLETVKLKVNGKNVRLLVQPETTLVELLRDKLELTGTKVSCNNGECGGCTVLLDGRAVYSCHMLALDAAGKEVITIEGLMNGEELHPLQQAFIDEDGLQCGFCTPGQIMAAYALLLKTHDPSKDEIVEAMSGNLCKCAAYPTIIKSVQTAAVRMK